MRTALLFLAFCAPVFATSYNVNAVRVIVSNAAAASACDPGVVTISACNSWVVEIDIGNGAANPAVGGTYALGFSRTNNNSPAAANVVLSVVHSGFLGGANCGNTTTYTQLEYGTHQLREPYNNAATNDETAAGGYLTIRLALGSATGPAVVFSGDTATVTIAAGIYTDGSGNTNNAFSGSVTNNSTLAYSTARAIFNWTYPGWQRITGSSFTVRGTGASQWAFNSTPLACVIYTVSDAHAHTQTITVSMPTIDPTLLDAAPIVDWIGTIPTGTFTQGDKLTANFKAYPWIGTSASVMDSSDGVYSVPTPFYAPQYYVNDTSNTYAYAAAVDPSQNVTGSVTSGVFTAGEQVKQGTSNAIAYLIGTVTGSNPMIIGATVSGSPDNSHTWVGQTSSAVYTPNATPVANGSDANACAVLSAAYNYPTTPSVACATVSGGLAKGEALNNSTYSRPDACGDVYLVTSAGWNWLGAGSATSNTTGNCYATIQNAAGITSWVQNQVGNQGFGTRCSSTTNCGTPLHLKGIKVNVSTGPVSVFSGITYLWVDCLGSATNTIAANGTAPFYQFRIAYVTGCAMPSTFAANGLRAFGAENAAFSIVRGSDLSTVGAAGIPSYTVVGNTNKSAQNLYITDTTTGPPAAVMPIVAFNTLYKMNQGSGVPIRFFASVSSPIGAVVAQNLIENLQTDTAPCIAITADLSSGSPVNNVILANNTLAGCRINRAYNENGTTGLLRQLWLEAGNIFPVSAIKADTFPVANQNRAGGWQDLYGNGNHSNVYWEDTALTVAGQFCNEFFGVNSYSTVLTAGATQPPTCTKNADSFIAWKNNQAYNGSAGAGGGNYNLLSSSPAINMFPAGTVFLPYDLNGSIRNNSGFDSAGSFSQGVIVTGPFSW